jgi:hypothetical protein
MNTPYRRAAPPTGPCPTRSRSPPSGRYHRAGTTGLTLAAMLSGLDPALTLVVPDHQGARATEDASRFRTLPFRLGQGTRLGHAALVRPSGYVVGRTAPEQYPRLLDLLARALGA